MIAKISGPGQEISEYEVSDREMASGSTLGAAKAALIVKSTGALEKVYSCEAGADVFGTLVLHHWDRNSGIPLQPAPGQFIIHPYAQGHVFELSNGVQVREEIFMLSSAPKGADKHHVDPPAAYYTVEMHNDGDEPVEVATYASVRLHGGFSLDLQTAYDEKRHAFLACSDEPKLYRVAACSVRPASYEITANGAAASAVRFPGPLSNETPSRCSQAVGIFHLDHALQPGGKAQFAFVLTFSSQSDAGALEGFDELPHAKAALHRTWKHYDDVLRRAVVMTPDPEVNRGALWAKGNMLRAEQLTEQGWCFVNDPTRSNNSVARDTAWFALGADYITPYFARESLLWYAEHLEASGLAVEFFDIRNGKTEDYGLNVNDDTPLLIIALWHHYCTSGDRTFLQRSYPNACRAADYILSQRNDVGLISCRTDGTGTKGIAGWRNVIQGYRLAGATTEVNSECFAALQTLEKMAREMGDERQAARYHKEARALRAAINEHLLDRKRNLYYLTREDDGSVREDITCDLVFPVLFGVAERDVATNIIATLSRPEFWTAAGLHTVPRNDVNYGPSHEYGLLGGVWGGPTFWFAAAAADFNPSFMAHALSESFRHYAQDPRRYNTVPGQFSEWLHGETLVNQGMMLSPWFAPKYLWTALEGAGGLDVTAVPPKLEPRMPGAWQWLAVRNACVRGRDVSWFTFRCDALTTYATGAFESVPAARRYDEDVTDAVAVTADNAVHIALRRDGGIAILIGNTRDRTITTSVRVDASLAPRSRLRRYDSLIDDWTEMSSEDVGRLDVGLAVEVERHGFCVLESVR
ncbi:MAG: amylo-alpha-1,6-glucosidase [Candidatus Tyrphobacter sp.]